MSSCRKCKDSIRPAASAVTIKGEEFHPTCVSCSRCERCIWGKEFNRSTDGSLQCVRACTPINRPSSPPRLSTAVVLQQQQQQSQQYRQMGKPIQFTETGINKKGRNGASRYMPVVDMEIRGIISSDSSKASDHLTTDRF